MCDRCDSLETRLREVLAKREIAEQTLRAIESVNDRTCPRCATHIVSVSLVRDAERGRNRIVWTCCNGCADGDEPLRWCDYLDEELDTVYAAKDAEIARLQARIGALLEQLPIQGKLLEERDTLKAQLAEAQEKCAVACDEVASRHIGRGDIEFGAIACAAAIRAYRESK